MDSISSPSPSASLSPSSLPLPPPPLSPSSSSPPSYRLNSNTSSPSASLSPPSLPLPPPPLSPSSSSPPSYRLNSNTSRAPCQPPPQSWSIVRVRCAQEQHLVDTSAAILHSVRWWWARSLKVALMSLIPYCSVVSAAPRFLKKLERMC